MDHAATQLTSDLQSLSAAAQGHPNQQAGEALTEEERRRLARIAELKAQFEAGTLRVDSQSIASKLVDDHLRE